jgi:hypothetical protein
LEIYSLLVLLQQFRAAAMLGVESILEFLFGREAAESSVGGVEEAPLDIFKLAPPDRASGTEP